MSKNLDPVLVTQAIQNVAGGSAEISSKLQELLFKRLNKEQEEEDEKIRLIKISREANAKAMADGRLAELEKQTQCPHQKPYGESALVGQRMHSRNYLYLCQYCSKEWLNNEVPLHLRIDANLVGGPNFISLITNEIDSFSDRFTCKNPLAKKFNED